MSSVRIAVAATPLVLMLTALAAHPSHVATPDPSLDTPWVACETHARHALGSGGSIAGLPGALAKAENDHRSRRVVDGPQWRMEQAPAYGLFLALRDDTRTRPLGI